MHPISSSKANEITSILISTLLTINSNGICLHSLLESIQVRTKGKRFPVLLFTLLSMTIFDCFSTVIDKIAKPLSHPSFIPHWELDFFFSLFAKNSWIPFCRFYFKSIFVFFKIRASFLSDSGPAPWESISFYTRQFKSIRIQHTELERYMCFTYEHIHSFYTIPQCGQGGSWSALYPPIKNTKIYVCFTGMWVASC